MSTLLKAIRKLRILLFFIVSVITAFHADAQRSDLFGTWVLDVNLSVEHMNVQSRARFDSLGEEVKQRAMISMEGRKFTFETGGKVTVTWSFNGETLESIGVWGVGNDPDEVLEITIGDIKEVYDFEFDRSHSLILKNRSHRGLFQMQYFVRQ